MPFKQTQGYHLPPYNMWQPVLYMSHHRDNWKKHPFADEDREMWLKIWWKGPRVHSLFIYFVCHQLLMVKCGGYPGRMYLITAHWQSGYFWARSLLRNCIHWCDCSHWKDIKVGESVFMERKSCCGLLFCAHILCSHFLSSCTDIQGLDISGSQTNRFYPLFVQPVSSLLPLFITWPPLWLTVQGGWLTANILSSDIHSTILCTLPDPSVPEERQRRKERIFTLASWLFKVFVPHPWERLQKTAECSRFPRSTLWISRPAWLSPATFH